MPLKSGSSPKTISDNIRTAEKEGCPHEKAIAMSLNNAGKSNKRPKIVKDSFENLVNKYLSEYIFEDSDVPDAEDTKTATELKKKKIVDATKAAQQINPDLVHKAKKAGLLDINKSA